jgi:uncharacterized protein (DUF2235 family)
MKRLVFCFDGTWNQLAATYPSNVVLIAECVRPRAKDGTPQIVYYNDGVGTVGDARLRGGAMGVGLINHIREAYRFLIFNYEPGDEIFAFGFSRGAFSARSFVGFIRCAGIPQVNDAGRIDDAIRLYESGADQAETVHRDEARAFRLKYSPHIYVEDDEEDWRCAQVKDYVKGAEKLSIRYVGVWDTVGALGVPAFIPGAKRLNRRYGYHSCDLTPGIESARHAVAIDERRRVFAPTLWNNVDELNRKRGFKSEDIHAPYQQKWFPGVHGSVGGTGPVRKLSDDALGWIMAGARKAGLELNINTTSRIYDISPDFRASLNSDPDSVGWMDKGWVGRLKDRLLAFDRTGPEHIWQVSAAARRRWNAAPDELYEKKPYRPKTLTGIEAALAAPPEQARYSSDDLLAEHVVVPGDYLGKIARTYYGDGSKTAVIVEANRDLIDDPDELFVGWTLRIPKLATGPAPDAEVSEEAKKSPSG